MSKKASQFQKKVMSLGYRGKEIFKPLNTGWIDEHTACIREWIANIFFYTKNGTTIMIDAGYNYDGYDESGDTEESARNDPLVSVNDVEKRKVLLFGAGVIGAYLAHVLIQAGNEVTILAREERAKSLSQNGLVIKHHLHRKYGN